MPALAVHHTATEDSPWDASAAVAAMPNDDAVLRYCHAWQTQEAADAPHKSGDGDADDKKGSYKFPHHRTKGGPANVPGCRNGLARLSNANIPEGDKPGVKSHVQAHLDDWHKDHGDDNGKSDTENKGAPLVAMRFPGEHGIDLAALAGDAQWQRALRIANFDADERVHAHAARVRRLSNRAEWFTIKDYADGTPADLWLYDEIGFWGVSASDFQAQLAALQAPSITVHINSPGGDVFDGIAILNQLRAQRRPVDVVVDGMAASAASLIAMAADTLTMMPQSQLMIHDAWGMCAGNAADMTDMAGLLDHISGSIAQAYAMRSGASVEDMRTAMRAETWYSAEEAVAVGLADRVGEISTSTPAPVEQAAAQWNWSFYAYSGRGAAPAPLIPSSAPAVEASAPPDEAVVDTTVIRDALRAAFAPKEARQ